MWFGEHRQEYPRRLRPLGRATVALGIATTIATLVASSPSAVRTPTRCVRFAAGVVRYCGPASARLSVFPGVVFKGGFCLRKLVGEVRLLQVRIGMKALDGSRFNDGLTYFSLGAAGSRSRPKSGNVIAYYRSRRWVGRVVSLEGDAGGSFVTEGIGSSRGRATGQFRC